MACVFPTTAQSVDEWLDALNLARYKPVLASAGLHVAALPSLTDEALSAAGVAVVGHRRRMLQAAKELMPPANEAQGAPPAQVVAPPADADMMDVADSPAFPPRQPMGGQGTQPMASPMPGSGPVGVPAGVPAASAFGGSGGFGAAGGSGAGGGFGASSGGGGGSVASMAASAKERQQQKANSTSSIFITSTLVKPDTDEVVFCIAAVIHDRIQQGEAQSSDERHRFPFFSEDNNPLYAPPPDRSNEEGSGSDSSMKRTRREIPTEDMIFHTIRSVYECARIPAECLIVSLVYIERLIATSGCPMLVTSWRPILLSSLILAQKVWDDRSLHNIDFSVFCPMFTLREINFLEKKVREASSAANTHTHPVLAAHAYCSRVLFHSLPFQFLELIDYDVSISASLYASYYFQLRTLCQRVDKEFSLKPMDIETAAKLEARGVAYKDKFKTEHGVVRKHLSDNHIQGHASKESTFLQKLFGS